jgi:hypothetical protein
VLGLLLARGVILLLVVLGRFRLGLGLLGLGLGLVLLLLLRLGRRRVGDGLVAVGRGGADDLEEEGLVRDGGVVAEDVGEGRAEGLAEDDLAAAGDEGCEGNVGEGDALGREEGVGEQVILGDLEERLGERLGVIDVLLVVRLGAVQGLEPAGNGGEKLLIGPGSPLKNMCLLLEGVAEQAGLPKTNAMVGLSVFKSSVELEHTRFWRFAAGCLTW